MLCSHLDVGSLMKMGRSSFSYLFLFVFLFYLLFVRLFSFIFILFRLFIFPFFSFFSSLFSFFLLFFLSSLSSFFLPVFFQFFVFILYFSLILAYSDFLSSILKIETQKSLERSLIISEWERLKQKGWVKSNFICKTLYFWISLFFMFLFCFFSSSVFLLFLVVLFFLFTKSVGFGNESHCFFSLLVLLLRTGKMETRGLTEVDLQM